MPVQNRFISPPAGDVVFPCVRKLAEIQNVRILLLKLKATYDLVLRPISKQI
jgi:hypothetical protein